MLKHLLPFTLLALLVGCSTMEKRTYDLSVKNDTSQPITIWLTKNGPAYEPTWESPEDLAAATPRNQRAIAGVVVPPGKTASTAQSGQFAPSTSAILRVYLGALSINEILAVGRGSPNRADVRLYPGKSDWTVFTQGGKLMVEPTK
jgi:hypothetical protein